MYEKLSLFPAYSNCHFYSSNTIDPTTCPSLPYTRFRKKRTNKKREKKKPHSMGATTCRYVPHTHCSLRVCDVCIER
jgi:hypothetical protein